MNEKSKFHSSILKIKESFESLDKCSFQSFTTDEVRKEILDLYDTKTTQCGDIAAKILKDSIDSYLVELTNIINSSFENECFREELKMTEGFPIFKKKDILDRNVNE